MTFTLIFGSETGKNDISTTDIIAVRFAKERYTPYTQIIGKAVIDGAFSIGIKNIKLLCDGTLLHFGPPDTLECEYRDGVYFVSFSSRGYTSMLGQNQMTPDMYFNVTFEELLTSGITLPHVELQPLTARLNYVYIKDNDTLWDAAAAFTRKLIGGYPYIRGANTVFAVRDTYDGIVSIPKEDIISASVGENFSHSVSHYHMKNADGNYNTYNLVNEAAVAADIIRHKHIPLDSQWLGDPDEAMLYRIDFSERGRKYVKVCYNGFMGEDIRQHAEFSAGGISARVREISRIELSVTARGAITTLWFYNDNYTDGRAEF